MAQEASHHQEASENGHHKGRLGPLLCWAVVFADIGTSVYYTPGILYQRVGSLAGFFVFLTMSVFVLLTLKYAEVTERFSQGGGVATVATQALNRWFGALGGMFILVDYFLTAAISCLSGMIYLSVVFPVLGPYTLWITIGILLLLGLLNWVGISESAKVSLVGATVAFVSDLAILVMVFSHISFGDFLALFPRMFAHQQSSWVTMLAGFAGSFLAFSGLESISQLSPTMKAPRKKVAGIALLLVVLTIGITSPVLTVVSTMLLPDAANNAQQNSQIISLLAGHWGAIWLQTAVAISASALLVFASNMAIIGAYHVFMALSRMDFLPGFILRRNKLRGTPHYSIALAMGVPIAVLLLVRGDIDILGDMYAFGLLGAFTLTCLGLDIVRHRERKSARAAARAGSDVSRNVASSNGSIAVDARSLLQEETTPEDLAIGRRPAPPIMFLAWLRSLWRTLDFWLGVLTTLLVLIAWSTNLVSKPLATAFGGSISVVGMLIAYLNYRRSARMGRIPVAVTGVDGQLPEATLVVLQANDEHNEAVLRCAFEHANGHPLVFLYVGEPKKKTAPGIFEVADPYLYDEQAKEWFGKAEALARKKKSGPRRYVYRQRRPEVVASVWQIVHPRDTIMDTICAERFEDINPDRVRVEVTPAGPVAHMLKSW